MIDARLQEVLNFADLASAPSVTRFYRDGAAGTKYPNIVVQRDAQGIRVMLRVPASSDDMWTSAWFDDDGKMLSIEKFSTGDKPLDLGLADEFLASLASQPLGDMARESKCLGAE